MMPLALANIGEENMILKVGGDAETKRHLEDLGFVAGGPVTLVSSLGGNVIPRRHQRRDGAQDHDLRERGGKIKMKTLREAKIGDTVKVVKLHGEGPVKRRIMDMGITKGVEVYVRKVAPLGDPMEVTVRGYELSLRKADTEMIEVE